MKESALVGDTCDYIHSTLFNSLQDLSCPFEGAKGDRGQVRQAKASSISLHFTLGQARDEIWY